MEVVRNNEWTPKFGTYVSYKVRNMIVGADDKIWLSGNVSAIHSVRRRNYRPFDYPPAPKMLIKQ